MEQETILKGREEGKMKEVKERKRKEVRKGIGKDKERIERSRMRKEK